MNPPTIDQIIQRLREENKSMDLSWQSVERAMIEWADEVSIKFGLWINENWLYFDTHVGLWKKSENDSWGHKTHAELLELFKKENP